MSDGGKGCCGCIVVICALPFLFGGFNIAKLAFRDLMGIRERHLEEKAKQEESRKAQEAENARIAEAKRQQEARVAAEKRQRD